MGLLDTNAQLVALAEQRRLHSGVDFTWKRDGRTLTLSTGEVFAWKQGSGWVRPDGSRADGRAVRAV